MTDLHHFYHVYSKGSWQLPLNEHLAALKHSDLINNLKTFQIGIVGPPETRQEVKNYLNSEGINYSVCSEVDDGWEQETQDKLFEFAQDNDGYVLYAHTKNAVTINSLHINWRKSMTYHTVIIWEDVVKHLDEGFCAVGSHYLEGGNENVKTASGFFGGTFWWTKLKYVRNFPEKPSRENRYGAEGWIGWLKPTVEQMGEPFKIYDYVPYHPSDESKMVKKW